MPATEATARSRPMKALNVGGGADVRVVVPAYDQNETTRSSGHPAAYSSIYDRWVMRRSSDRSFRRLELL
jgi:hypothetical protein